MPISSEYLKIIEIISELYTIPLIREILIPINYKNDKISNFAAIILDDHSTGIFFTNLSQATKKSILERDYKDLIGADPSIIAQKFSSNNLIDKSIGLGCINAISQFYLKVSGFNFD